MTRRSWPFAWLLFSSLALCGQTLTITAPNTGGTLYLNTPYTIRWTSSGVSGGVRLLLFRDSTKLGAIATGVNASLGQHAWTVGRLADGTTAPAGTNYRVRIVSGSGEDGVSDFGDAPFAISPDPGPAPASLLRLIKPGGGKLMQGEYCSIAWESRDLQGTVRLALFRNKAKVMDISGDLPASPGLYRWEVGRLANGGMAPVGDNYLIGIKAAAGVSDFGDEPFHITRRTGGWARSHGGVKISVQGTFFKPGERLTFTYDCPCGFPTGAEEYTESIFLKRQSWRERSRWIGIGMITRDATSGSKTIDLAPGLDQADDWVIAVWWGRDDCWGESAPFSIRRPAGSPILRFPHDGETLYREWDFEIDWDRTLPDWDRVKIQLLKGDTHVTTLARCATEKKWWRVGTEATWNSGRPAPEGWVYGSYADGSDFRIRLEDCDTGQTVESGYFSIVRPWISILVPSGPARFNRGQRIMITWRAHHLPPHVTEAHIKGFICDSRTGRCNINLGNSCFPNRDGWQPPGKFNITDSTTAAEGNYSWLVPVEDISYWWPCPDCDPFKIKIQVHCLQGSYIKGETDLLTISHN